VKWQFGQLVLPAGNWSVTYANGSKKNVRVPAETWIQNTTHAFTLEGAGLPSTDANDRPGQAPLPDRDRSNNSSKPNTRRLAPFPRRA